MVAAPPHHQSIARALGPVGAAMRAALGEVPQVPGAATRVVVAVSGGADSMATLGLLELLRRRLRLELVVAHVDHGLRPGSSAEAQFVGATARARGHQVWLRRLALNAGPGLPARARAARRDALLQAAMEHDAGLVVLGHTMTDQFETVVLNLCRGAGLQGMGAMAPHQAWEKPDPAWCRQAPRGLWVRPMMQLTREETRQLASRLELPFVDDPGNDDDSQPRVRLRKYVLPALQAINVAVVSHVAASAGIAREAAAALRPPRPPLAASGSPASLRDLPAALGRTHLLALCREAGLAPDAVAARTLDGVMAALPHDAPRRWNLSGAVLHLEAGRVWIESTRGEPLTHPIPAAILLAPGRNA